MKYENDLPNELTMVVELVMVEGMMEAEIIKSKLESFEIPCMLKFEAVGRVLGITTDGLGQVQVMVPPDYLERAKDIINSDTDSEQPYDTD